MLKWDSPTYARSVTGRSTGTAFSGSPWVRREVRKLVISITIAAAQNGALMLNS